MMCVLELMFYYAYQCRQNSAIADRKVGCFFEHWYGGSIQPFITCNCLATVRTTDTQMSAADSQQSICLVPTDCRLELKYIIVGRTCY